MTPFARLAKDLERAQATWSQSTSAVSGPPPDDSGEVGLWLDVVIAGLASEQIALIDLEYLRTVFGGASWSRAHGDEALGQEIIRSLDALSEVVLNRRGKALVHAAKDLLAPGEIVQIEALRNMGEELGYGQRETDAILWALAHRSRFLSLKVWYPAIHAQTGDFRDDLQVDAYQLTEKGKAILI